MFNLQAVFAKDRAVVHRSYGDALTWSGKPGRPDPCDGAFKQGSRPGTPGQARGVCSRVTASLSNARLIALQDAAASWEKMVWPHGSDLDSNAL